MAQQQIITKPYVGELQDNDSLFINHDGALRQIKKSDVDFASGADMRAEVAAREAFEAREVAAREAFEESETEAREQFETSVEEQMAEKANVDGYYEEMTVGDAEQLVATQFVEDSEPYLFRPTGGSSDVGNRAYVDKIIGGTVAWNQLINAILQTVTRSGVTITNNGDGSFTLNGTASANYNFIPNRYNSTFLDGHVYYLSGWKRESGNQDSYFGISGIQVDRGNGGLYKKSGTATNWNYRIDFSSGEVFNNLKVYPQATDLTLMLGSTIADYIYNLEQSSAGAGVTWFKKLFPKDYYEYNTGELLSVEGLESHDTVGFNQWDEEWENGYYDRSSGNKAGSTNTTYFRCKNLIPCFPETTYYIKEPAKHASNSTWLGMCFYDADKNFIGSRNDSALSVKTRKNVYYMSFYVEVGVNGSTYQHDICINLSSPSRNGEYEEYVKHSYPLDNSLTLRGIPKLDSFNNLYYDGDEYESDGTVTRKYGIVDLGTLAWTYQTTGWGAHPTFVARYDGINVPNGTVANFICTKYTTVSANTLYAGGDKSIADNGDYVRIRDTAFTDAQTFKTAMSGVYLVYELATPTTEEAEPFQYTQIVDDLGTEEFVSNGFIPAGHLTEYPANLRDKLQHLPDLAGMDGTYLIRQTGNQMSLVYMPAVFPEIPTEDGTYTLETVVTGGVATLQWVAK